MKLLRLPRTTTYDLTLIGVVLALTLLGIAMVYSASGIRALDTLDDPRYYLTWQAVWAVLGLAGMLAAMRIDYHRYRVIAVPLVVVVVLLLILVLIPGVGVRAGGAARWLRAGPVGLQPAGSCRSSSCRPHSPGSSSRSPTSGRASCSSRSRCRCTSSPARAFASSPHSPGSWASLGWLSRSSSRIACSAC
jgi:hypothetical protein